MTLETERGGSRPINSESDLGKALKDLGPGNEFLILSDGERFIQCAGGGDGLYFEYSEGDGIMHVSERSDVSLAEGEEILSRYLNRNAGWESSLSWRSEEIPESSRGSAGTAESRHTDAKGKSFTDMIKDEAVRNLKREVARKTSGTIGRLIRKITR